MASDTGSYEIWKQPAGLEARHVITLHDRRDAKSVLQLFVQQETAECIRLIGHDSDEAIKIVDETAGFSVGLTNGFGKTQHVVMYWWNYVPADGEPELDYEIDKALRYAERAAGNNPERYL